MGPRGAKIAGDDPAKQLLAVFDVMDSWFNDPDFLGCMFVNAAAEFPNPHDPVHQAAAAYKQRRSATTAATWPAPPAPTRRAAETFADCYTALSRRLSSARRTAATTRRARFAPRSNSSSIRTRPPVCQISEERPKRRLKTIG